ncbi:MAG: hypothetical protein ACI8TP_003050 [Acidimicrobiales bacterium]|jgi:hypothetical protein
MTRKWMKRVLLMGAITLAVAACGSKATDTTDANLDEAVPVGGELPLADAADDSGAVVSAGCAEGEPLCDDTAVVPNEGTDLPPVADGDPIDAPPPIAQPEPDPGQSVSSGMPANGGITVSAALATETTGVLAVQGHLYDDGSGPRLCEGLQGGGERYVCGGANVQVKDLDAESLTAALL